MNKIELYNWENSTTPNILHFQGKAKNHYSYLFDLMSKNKIKNDERINIVTCVSDESQSKLIKQLKENNIPFVNCYKCGFYHVWQNPMKIKFIYDFLLSADENKTYLILDGYDTAIQTLDGLFDKLVSSKKDVLFNSTKHNWPDVFVDQLPERDFRGEFRCFNAGCVIGYGKLLKKFYKNCFEELNETKYNPWESEQYIVRKVWSNYAQDEYRYIDFDWECNIFQTFGSTKLEKLDENKYIVL